ncbi:hypothetical protein ACI48J_04990 [Paenibacillus chitinolyticus]|uniref:hypothetical protein n=1 Tax=Paenibacillus chitinolyticus TaxID=79263 RepID=UPI003867A6FB
MHTQVIICNEMHFDGERKTRMLGEVINQMTIQALPAVINLSLLIKIIDMPKGEEVSTEIKIIDPSNEVIGTTSYVHRNYRKPDEVPGVDQHIDYTLLIETIGTILFKIYINGDLINWYPVQIYLD